VLLLGGFQMGGQGLRWYGTDLVIDPHPTSALGLRLHLGEAGGELGAAVYRLGATVLQRGLSVCQRRVGPRVVLGDEAGEQHFHLRDAHHATVLMHGVQR